MGSKGKFIAFTFPDCASTTQIKGAENVHPKEYANYTCTSGVSDPASNMSMKVKDQNGKDVPVVVDKMMVRSSIEIMKGFISSISFGIVFNVGMEHVEIECRAANEVCEVASLHRTKVICKYAY